MQASVAQQKIVVAIRLKSGINGSNGRAVPSKTPEFNKAPYRLDAVLCMPAATCMASAWSLARIRPRLRW